MLKIPYPKRTNPLPPYAFVMETARDIWLESHGYEPKGSIGEIEIWCHSESGNHVLAMQNEGVFIVKNPDRKEIPNETKIQQHLL